MENIDDRIVQIETRMAWLEDFVQKIQEIVLEHTENIDILRKENKFLSSKLGELQDTVQDIPSIRPPHY